MITSTKHIDLQKTLSINILSNRSTARLLFSKTQEMKWESFILDFEHIAFASRSFMDELNALIKDQRNKTYLKENMSEDVQKMDQLVLHSQENKVKDSPNNTSQNTDVVTI